MTSFLIRQTVFAAVAVFGMTAVATAANVVETFSAPAGYTRVAADSGSFTHYLRQLNILPDTAKVRRFDGSAVTSWPRSVRVLDLPFLFHSDLEQCADVGYRLFSDYARSTGLDSLLHFKLQNGQAIYWNRWKRGKHLRYDARHDRHITTGASPDSSDGAYLNFLHYLFQWTGSAAMKAYLKPVAEDQLQPGDVIVQNTTGGMGHVSIIIDKCVNLRGDALYLIANGWTPAQTPFIWKAEEGNGSGYWFTIAGYRRHLAPFNFGPFSLRSFRQSN